MLTTIWEFVKRHILKVFLQGVRDYFVRGAARNVGRKIKEKVMGRKPEWICSSCHSMFTKAFLFDGFWLMRGECPSCQGKGTLERMAKEPRKPEDKPVDRIYKVDWEKRYETVPGRRGDQAAGAGAPA